MDIIVVDDEELALEGTEMVIQKAVPDANIHAFRSAQEALQYLQNGLCDVAFLGIKMKGINGLELAKAIKELSEEINIVFVTSYTEYAFEAFGLYASGYLLKPVAVEDIKQVMGHLRNPIQQCREKKVHIQCFGNFEVFVDDKPIIFKRAKTKELLAYLTDRKGAACSMAEIRAVLWENAIDNNSQRSHLRNLIHDLKKTLSEVGAEDIIVKGWNFIRLNRSIVDCDYFDFLCQVPSAVNCYRGEYMAQYSWAEPTAASLTRCLKR